jgi:hypothetical protein
MQANSSTNACPQQSLLKSIALHIVFLLGSILSYVVWWQRDIRLGVSLHIVANAFASLTFWFVAMEM